MQIVFIIFGLIIVLSFITGVILTMKEKKKNAGQVLTDDPKILFDIPNDETSVIKKDVSDTSSVVDTNVLDEATEVTPVVSNTEVIPTTNDSNSKFVFQPLPVVETQPVNVLTTNIVNTPVSSNTVSNSNQNSVSIEEELI